MHILSERNWRIHFWNQWEDWEDRRDSAMLGVFATPVAYMNWAERGHADLGCQRPWEFLNERGVAVFHDYLRYLSTKDYWDGVCSEYLERAPDAALPDTDSVSDGVGEGVSAAD